MLTSFVGANRFDVVLNPANTLYYCVILLDPLFFVGGTYIEVGGNGAARHVVVTRPSKKRERRSTRALWHAGTARTPPL